MVIANEASSTISCPGDVSRGIIITQMHIMQTVGISLGFLIDSLTASETYNTASFIYLQRNFKRPGSYVAFLPRRMQFKQKIMKQIISLSIVSNAFDSAEMRRMKRALAFIARAESNLCQH